MWKRQKMCEKVLKFGWNSKKSLFFVKDWKLQATFFGIYLSKHNISRRIEMNFWNDRQGTGRRMYTGRPEMPALSVGQIFQENNGIVFAILSESRGS
jgi:hypothetical protein